MNRKFWVTALFPLWGVVMPLGLLSPWVIFSINATDSLPGTLFIVVKKNTLNINEIGIYQSPKSSYLKGRRVGKIIKAKAFDQITVIGRKLYINGRYLSKIKTESLEGKPLKAIKSQVISKDSYYGHSPHKDSYDSRYQSMGLIPKSRIIGAAYRLF